MPPRRQSGRTTSRIGALAAPAAMGREGGTPGKGGGKKDSPFRDMAGMFATAKGGHSEAAEAARLAYKAADGKSPHPVAAQAAVACAHLEAASRYAAAARLLARSMESNGCGNLRTHYIRRIAVLVRRSASLSAKASKIMGRLADDGNLRTHEYADSVRRARRLATRSAEDDRTTHKALRAALHRLDEKLAAK